MFNNHVYDNQIYKRLEKKYNEEKDQYYEIIQKVENERQTYLNNSQLYRFLLLTQKNQFIYYIASTILIEIIFPSILLIPFCLLSFYFCYVKLKATIPRYEKRVLEEAGKRWLDLIASQKYSQNKIEELNKNLVNEYDKICSRLTFRPPDWSIRRDKVLKRDNYTCTQCGWPHGYKRKTRELHVHHIKPLSKGGNNSLENLITLCHICHKGLDNMHHSVRNSRRKPKNKNN